MINKKKKVSFRYFELKIERKSEKDDILSLELNKEYRHFNIKEADGNDDYAQMREVITRRYTRLMNENAELCIGKWTKLFDPNFIAANGRNLMGGGDFLGHLIKGDALGACNGTFVRIVRPGREDEEATRSDGIEKEVGGFEVIAEAVVGEIDDIAIVMKERVERFLFIARDERRDHDCAFGGGIETACFVVFEGLVVAMFSGIFDPHATDVDGLAKLLHEDTDITYGIVSATVDLDVVLDAEEAGVEALSSEAGGVHLDVTDHRLELAVCGHGAEEGFLREDGELEPDAISANRRTWVSRIVSREMNETLWVVGSRESFLTPCQKPRTTARMPCDMGAVTWRMACRWFGMRQYWSSLISGCRWEIWARS